MDSGQPPISSYRGVVILYILLPKVRARLMLLARHHGPAMKRSPRHTLAIARLCAHLIRLCTGGSKRMIKAFGMPLHTRQTPHECQNRAFYGTSLHNCAARAAYTRLLHAAATEPFRTCKVPMDAAKKRPRRPPGSRQVASPAAMICATDNMPQ